MHTSGASRREIANEYLRLDTALVPRMLRSAISAFTRVFDALCLRRAGLLVRGLWLRNKGMGPGSAEQREGRCTASGTQ